MSHRNAAQGIRPFQWIRAIGLGSLLTLLANGVLYLWISSDVSTVFNDEIKSGLVLTPEMAAEAVLDWKGELRARESLREGAWLWLGRPLHWLLPRTTMTIERFAIGAGFVTCSDEDDCARKFEKFEPKKLALLSRLFDKIQGLLPMKIRRYINGPIQLATWVLFVLGLELVAKRNRQAQVAHSSLEGEKFSFFRSLLVIDGESLTEGDLEPEQIERALKEGTLRNEVADMGDLYPVFKEATLDLLRSFNQTGALSEARDALTEALIRLQLYFEEVGVWVRYITWVIPSVGFIGTILGIGNALGGAHKVVQDEGRQEQAIQAVTGQLAVAFDTTLVALLCSVVLMFLRSKVESREQAAVGSFEAGCRRFILQRLRVESVTRELTLFLSRVTQETVETAHRTWEDLSRDREMRVVAALKSLIEAMGGHR